MASWLVGASAAPRICTTADTLLFGQRMVGSTTTSMARVSNCGDMPWSFTGVSVDPVTNTAFHVDTACATGLVMAPGDACAVTVRFEPLVPGQASGGLWLHNTTSTPDQLITFYGRGVNAEAGAASVVFAPARADFGAVILGVESGPLEVRVQNQGTSALVPSAIVINGAAPYDFRGETHGSPTDCRVGTPVAAGSSCGLTLFFRPQQAGMRNATLWIDAPQLGALTALVLSGDGTPQPAATPMIDVVEFHHSPSDQYFITSDTAEAAFLDAGGLGTGWVRTGAHFRAWPRGVPAGFDVCRFFGTPGIGPDSHFYTADAAECAAVKRNPHWIAEGIAFRTAIPLAGACTTGYSTVIRLWKPGVDTTGTRHRYTADPATVTAMAAAGWVVEGPVFCVPN